MLSTIFGTCSELKIIVYQNEFQIYQRFKCKREIIKIVEGDMGDCFYNVRINMIYVKKEEEKGGKAQNEKMGTFD